MSYRPSNSTLHTTSFTSSHTQTTSAALTQRIASKRAELAHLQSLRDLSSSLASQMSALETQLRNLRDGTEAVATVMGNWEGVLGAIAMVGGKIRDLAGEEGVKAEDGDGEAEFEDGEAEVRKHGEKTKAKELPVTLVRIPVEQASGAGGAG